MRSPSSKSCLLHSKFRVSLGYVRLLSQKTKTTKSPAPARLSQLKMCNVKSGERRFWGVAALGRGTDKGYSDLLLPSPDPSKSVFQVLTLGFG